MIPRRSEDAGRAGSSCAAHQHRRAVAGIEAAPGGAAFRAPLAAGHALTDDEVRAEALDGE
jgi:hypothetical protein